MAPRARVAPAPAKTHARPARRASFALLLALGLALACAGIVVPRSFAATDGAAGRGDGATALEAEKHGAGREADERAAGREAKENEAGGEADEDGADGEAGEYGAGEDSEYGRAYASGGDDSAYFPAPTGKLRAAARANPPASAEAETRAIDTALLGPEHAAEHAAARRAEREWARLGHQPRMQNPKDALSSRGVAPLQNAGNEDPPSEVGEWTTSPFNLPTYAINATVLATGKVLFWGRPPDPLGAEPRANVGQAAVWSPSMGTGPDAFQDVAPPLIDPDGPGGQAAVPAPIFCSGLSQLPDGEVVVAGGTMVYANTSPDDAYTYYAGLRTVFTFDPFGETWTQQPNMAHGRWYPSQTLLPDGRTIFTGGLNEDAPGGVQNKSVEVFDPPSALGGLGSIDEEPSADRGLGTYPRTFSVGDNLLVAGPKKNRVAILDTSNFTWHGGLPDMSRNREHDMAVRAPGGTDGSNSFTEIGGYDGDDVGDGDVGEGDDGDSGESEFYPATGSSETIDVDDQKPAWMPDAPLNVPRANANTVLLPDGSMVTVGGGSGYDPGDGGGYVTYADGRARQVELYDPQTKSWRLGPAQQEDRAYHSTAVLLPDGRVFSAGDDLHPLGPDGGRSPTDTAEIYSPPYLFKGARPQIDSAPQTINWGDAFGVASSSPDIDRAVLMAPGATTHGFDMNQRYVKLRVLDSVDGKGVDLLAPPSPSAAPPGYYMLFLINKAGVPSVASWVRIDGQAPDQPLIGPAPAGDFNGDGFPDLAIAAPDAAVGDAEKAGAVHVVYGSGSGISSAQSQLWTESRISGDEAAAPGDDFGAALATGDFNGDGYADLAVGAPGDDASGADDAGAVDVLYGSPDGLSATGVETLSEGNGGIADAAESGDRYGAALAAADLSGDGSDDLAVGAPAEGVKAVDDAGAVNVIYGSSDGLTAAGDQLWTENSPGILDRAESGDGFGSSLSIGDLDGDGRADLAVGAPGEGTGRVPGAGAVEVIYASADGLSAARNQLWTQNSAGIADRSEAGDAFGSAIGIGDVNGDGDADLAIGVPGEGIGAVDRAGAVNVIYASADGLTASGNQFWTENSSGVLDRAEAGDSFGSAIGVADIDGDGNADLAIAAPGEGIGGVDDAGAVSLIDGSGAGLTAAGNQLWSQNSAEVVGTPEAGDGFGSAIAESDLDRDGRGDVAIGVPSDTVADSKDAGSVNVLYGADGGLGSAGNQLLDADTADLGGPAAADERFGAVLGSGAR